MKYMGSKRSMLLNGLGEALSESIPGHKRFVDLFTGSAAVAWHVAQKFDVEVMASDLQQYSVILASSVLNRTKPASYDVAQTWITKAQQLAQRSRAFNKAKWLQGQLTHKDVAYVASYARELCVEPLGPVANAYGGYYFSPLQAIILDSLRATIPQSKAEGSVALAALVWAASRCAASPGHTAQPFKPNTSAGKYLIEAWQKDIYASVHQSYAKIAEMVAQKKGKATRSEANIVAKKLSEGDIVFIDPPYSGVHYSRFYHVLETLSFNTPIAVSGEGRYPPKEMRPQSKFSIQTQSEAAIATLFSTIASSGATAIVTFPAGKTSNGLSGDKVIEKASQFFTIKSFRIASRFSTLVGNKKNRDARNSSEELVITLTPRG